MTMRTPPAWLQAGSHPSEHDRLLLEALLQRRPGVVPSAAGDLVVTEKAGTANMSVDVAAGHCIVDGSLNAHQGVYHGYNDATVNKTIAAADATNPRKDLVTVRVRDAAYSGADNDIDIIVTTGTPTPGLVQGDAVGEPTAPANSLKLARVFVPAADTAITNSQINDLRTLIATVGGTVLCTSTTRPSAPHEGMEIYETDTDRSLVYNGTTWVQPNQQLAANNVLHVRDEKTAGTGGGNFASGAFRTRVLNTVKTNTIVGASLAANQFVLPAGTYWIDASAPAGRVNSHVAKLRNITDGADVIIGTTELISQDADVQNFDMSRSHVRGAFTIAAQKTFELQHRCGTTDGSGFGFPANVGVVEVYAEVIIWKVA